MKRETSSICEKNSFHREEIISTILVENVNHFSTMHIGVPLYPDSNLNFKDLVDKKVRIRGYALGMTGNNLNTMVIDAQVER